MANPIFVGEGEPHALLFRHLDLSLVQANLIPFMRNLDSFMENGLIETKIWMLGILVIPEASLLVDFFQLIEGEKMHVFIYANMSICTCMHTFILQAYMYACIHTHTHIYIVQFMSLHCRPQIKAIPIGFLLISPQSINVCLLHTENPGFQKYLHIPFT